MSTRSQNFATQRASIERAARARGDQIGHWYAEKRHSKATVRPELDALIARAHGGEIRRVYVYKIDRFTRRGIRDTLDVVDALHSRGCEIVAVGDPWFDLAGPFRELILAVMGWAAEHELLALGERIAAARARVEASGKHWGRPRRCDAATVAKIDRLARAGRSQRQIAIAVKVPRPTVAVVLARKGPYGKPSTSSQKRLNGSPKPPAAE